MEKLYLVAALHFILRYSSLNAQYSSGYRSYTSWIPNYMKDMPRKFVAHCMEKITLASRISSISICEEKERVVGVKIQGSDNEAGYIVQFKRKWYAK